MMCLPLATLASGEEDYRARLQAALETKDDKQVQTVLDAWGHAKPADPEYYIAVARRAYNRETVVVPAHHPPSTGEVVFITPATRGPSPADDQEAIAALIKAVEVAPKRIDIRLSLAVVYEASGNAGLTVKTLSEMAAFAKAHPGALLYEEGAPYPQPEEELLCLAIDYVANRYLQRHTPEADETFHALAQLDADAFPNQEYGYNLLGVYYTAIDKNPRLALASYEHALKIAPTDSLVWMNVGTLHARHGEKQAADAAFRKVVALDNDPGCVQQARAGLAELK